MWTINELIVFNDLHLTPERNTGSFHLDEELADCLRWILRETQECVIVLAGDVFDFLTSNNCAPQNGFARFTCHAGQIIEHHPEIFDALTRLAQSPQHTLVFMSGECDAELLIPDVQEIIERRLGFTTPNGSVRWLVLGEALRMQVGAAVALIEHGNTFDPWNRLDHAALQTTLSLASRNLPEPRVVDEESRKVPEPLGRGLTSRVINYMRSRHQWLDCLKPVNESILPLLWPLASQDEQKAICELAGDYESMKTEAGLRKLSNSPNPVALYQGEKEADRSQADYAFEDWIDLIYAQEEGAQTSSSKIIEKVRLISNHDSFFDIEQPNDTSKYLEPMFNGGADLIIHGHTRVAKICTLDSGAYINTGAWNQLIRLPKSHESIGVWQEFLEQLKTNTVARIARPTLAHVYQDKDANTVGELIEWSSAGPETMATLPLKTHVLTKE